MFIKLSKLLNNENMFFKFYDLYCQYLEFMVITVFLFYLGFYY